MKLSRVADIRDKLRPSFSGLPPSLKREVAVSYEMLEHSVTFRKAVILIMILVYIWTKLE